MCIIFACYCYNIFPSSNSTKSLFLLMFGLDPAEWYLSHLNNSNRYCGTNEGKIVLEELHKLWKQHTKHLKEMHNRNLHKDQQISKNNQKFEICQQAMVKNHAHHTFEPRYLLDYRILKIPNDSTLLLVTLDEKEKKTNINDAKMCSTPELIGNSFVSSIKTNWQNSKYKLRPWP